MCLQDNEYLASLLADREKEVNALKEAESLCLKEDESCKTLLEEEVMFLLIWLPDLLDFSDKHPDKIINCPFFFFFWWNLC